jgi:hypothetical protein
VLRVAEGLVLLFAPLEPELRVEEEPEAELLLPELAGLEAGRELEPLLGELLWVGVALLPLEELWLELLPECELWEVEWEE